MEVIRKEPSVGNVLTQSAQLFVPQDLAVALTLAFFAVKVLAEALRALLRAAAVFVLLVGALTVAGWFTG